MHSQQIIKDGFGGEICILGFPYHIVVFFQGAKRSGIKLGHDHAPDCLRRFLFKTGVLYNSELGIDISGTQITDYGNIAIEGDASLEHLLQKLSLKVSILINKNTIPIVIGGSRDTAYGAQRSLSESTHIINIIHKPDIEIPFDYDKASATNVSRLLRQSNKQMMTFFGHSRQGLTKEQIQYLKDEKINQIEIKDIRHRSVTSEKCYTQAGDVFEEFLKNCGNDNLHISFALEAIDSAFCPGVSVPTVGGGLSSDESLEIMYLSGQDIRVKSMDITDYNPIIEDYRTGYLISHMIYNFVLGRNAK